jgi:hypothetical protein
MCKTQTAKKRRLGAFKKFFKISKNIKPTAELLHLI